jgi:lysophospholipase L1-like esterase
MAKWDWIEKPESPATWGFALRVIIKAGIMLALCNAVYAIFAPIEALGGVSLYNTLLPGRERLPYGENFEQSYSLSLNNIPAMFASHVISRPKGEGEFRVVLIGDSGVWGWFLANEDTLAGQLNDPHPRQLPITWRGDFKAARAHGGATLQVAEFSPLSTSEAKWGGDGVKTYNLAYPIMSLTKDLLLLDEAMRHQPDMIVWLVTLESFPREKQLFPPLAQHNAARVRNLINAHDLQLDPADARLIEPNFFERTVFGQRRDLADWLRLQLYGFSWAATGIDQYIPDEIPLRQSDFEADESWQDFDAPVTLTRDDLAVEVLAAGVERAGDVPVLIVNEPIFISSGANSDLRYNSWYPRWAYDQYRALLAQEARANGWQYLDLWDSINPAEFTDSPVHLTATGTRALAELIRAAVLP